MKCEYCQGDYTNPFKYVYAPLWFAWYPVTTNNGVVFMKKVHRQTVAGSSGNYAGTYPVFWHKYLEHRLKDLDKQ